MSKRLGTYLLPAVLLLAALLPGRVCAQLDARSLMRAQQRGENTNLYGVPNPAPEDKEGQAQAMLDLAYALSVGDSLDDLNLENGKYIRLPYSKVGPQDVKNYMK